MKLAVLAALVAFPAYAQPVCTARNVMIEDLAKTYSETRHGIGIAPDGKSVMEIYASRGGSWTLTISLPDGNMCALMSGYNYEDVSEPLPGNL